MGVMDEKNAERLARLNAPAEPPQPTPAQSSEFVKVGGFIKVQGEVPKRKPGRPRTKPGSRNSDYILRKSDTTDSGAAYIPSPDEIAEATASIRAGWSEREALSRCQLPGAVPTELQMVRAPRYSKYLSGEHG